MYLGVAIVAAMIFGLAIIFARYMTRFGEEKSPRNFLIVTTWNVATISISFEILEYTSKHGEIVGPVELCLYLLVYTLASVGGAVAVGTFRNAWSGRLIGRRDSPVPNETQPVSVQAVD
jgi:drug/metabolite transporter (DMT)-like permease